jgi:hypothetical protein
MAGRFIANAVAKSSCDWASGPTVLEADVGTVQPLKERCYYLPRISLLPQFRGCATKNFEALRGEGLLLSVAKGGADLSNRLSAASQVGVSAQNLRDGNEFLRSSEARRVKSSI